MNNRPSGERARARAAVFFSSFKIKFTSSFIVEHCQSRHEEDFQADQLILFPNEKHADDEIRVKTFHFNYLAGKYFTHTREQIFKSLEKNLLIFKSLFCWKLIFMSVSQTFLSFICHSLLVGDSLFNISHLKKKKLYTQSTLALPFALSPAVSTYDEERTSQHDWCIHVVTSNYSFNLFSSIFERHAFFDQWLTKKVETLILSIQLTHWRKRILLLWLHLNRVEQMNESNQLIYWMNWTKSREK